MTKQPGWLTVSSQVTVSAAPGVSAVLGCVAVRATPHGSPIPTPPTGGLL